MDAAVPGDIRVADELLSIERTDPSKAASQHPLVILTRLPGRPPLEKRAKIISRLRGTASILDTHWSAQRIGDSTAASLTA